MPGRLHSLSVISLALIATLPLSAQQQWPGRDRLEAERCTPATGRGAEWIGRAIEATGMSAIQGALRFQATETNLQFFQSDRMYPPFLGASSTAEFSFDPVTGAERAHTLPPGGGRGRDIIRAPHALFGVRDTVVVPAPNGYRFFEAQRPLNPLAILAEWRDAEVTVVARCTFRDYPRTVLSRGTMGERLYLDSKTAVPVKYERIEPNPLWGQSRAEYVYATWWQAGPAILPVVAVRYLDGVEQDRRDLLLPQTPAQTLASVIPRAEAFPQPLPNPLPDHSAAPIISETSVDTVRVGPNTVLLTAPAYTHAVTLVRDTIYLMDATSGDWRSRADSVWISRLFPGQHPMVLVVTDLAWPHIWGVRFWVARGATIATHRLSRPFLQQVIGRKWTLAPDVLESSRGSLRGPKWIVVDSTATLAGGDVRLRAIDGVSSEGALMAMLPEAEFLWAGDYIQSAEQSSIYAREVMAAVSRAGFTPRQAAAQHLPLTPWTKVTAANPPS